MSMYSNRLQPALQNPLQRVVRFFHPRSSCTTHISSDVFGGRKSLVKPVTRQKTCNYSCSVLPPEIVMHDEAYIGGHSENNINASYMTISGGRRTKQLDIFSVSLALQVITEFHSCGTYSVLSLSFNSKWDLPYLTYMWHKVQLLHRTMHHCVILKMHHTKCVKTY